MSEEASERGVRRSEGTTVRDQTTRTSGVVRRKAENGKERGD